MPTDKQPRRYRLIKDLPNVNAGAILIPIGESYSCTDKYGRIASLHKNVVEKHSDWFAPVAPAVEERIEVTNIVFQEFAYPKDYHKKAYGLFVTKEIPKDKFPAIKQAIEAALNEDTPMSKEEVDKWINSTGNEFPKTDTVVEDKPVLFTTEQYKEIWDMIFSQTGFPPNHPKTKRNQP